MRAASLFFAVRGVVRTRLAQGKRLDPSKWLYVETMKFIANTDHPSMSALAEHLSITAPSATSLVRRLVKDKLVVREADTRDRRATRLSLTEKGRRVLADTLKRGAVILGEVFGVLSREELAVFTRALECIKNADGAC
jgi:DNA-binding MarR family transcriptional regulator